MSTSTESLIASLAVQDPTGIADVDEENWYFDWSTQLDDGKRRMEISDSEETVQIDMTREDMVRLHAALTVYLLTNPE